MTKLSTLVSAFSCPLPSPSSLYSQHVTYFRPERWWMGDISGLRGQMKEAKIRCPPKRCLWSACYLLSLALRLWSHLTSWKHHEVGIRIVPILQVGETEASRNAVTCPRLHSCKMTELGFKPDDLVAGLQPSPLTTLSLFISCRGEPWAEFVPKSAQSPEQRKHKEGVKHQHFQASTRKHSFHSHFIGQSRSHDLAWLQGVGWSGGRGNQVYAWAW